LQKAAPLTSIRPDLISCSSFNTPTPSHTLQTRPLVSFDGLDRSVWVLCEEANDHFEFWVHCSFVHGHSIKVSHSLLVTTWRLLTLCLFTTVSFIPLSIW
jgi:hypothetical protein